MSPVTAARYISMALGGGLLPQLPQDTTRRCDLVRPGRNLTQRLCCYALGNVADGGRRERFYWLVTSTMYGLSSRLIGFLLCM